MKHTVLHIALIVLSAVIMYCLTPYSYDNEEKMVFSAIVWNVSTAVVGTLCLIGINKGNMRAIAKTVLFSLMAYVQLLGGIVFYDHVTPLLWSFFLFQLLYGLATIPIAPNYRSLIVMLCSLIASTIWANCISGFMYFSRISSDWETIGVSSGITLLGVIITSVISIGCICMYRLLYGPTDK